MNLPQSLFDAYYFAHGCLAPYERNEAMLAFFDAIAERIVSDIRPATVLDAGCAYGLLVECLRRRGVQAFGVDISQHAIGQAHPDARPYCWVGSAAEAFPQRYDLIVSIEVLEHMPQTDAERAIVNFCQHSDDVLFSSTPFDYKEVTHFNVQPPETWAELFARHDFYRDVDFDASVITPWAVRFRKSSEPVHRLARDYERKYWLLWKENRDLRALSLEMRAQLAAQPQAAPQPQDNTQTAALQQQLDEIQSSQAWKLSLRLRALRQKLVPPASRRERWLQRIGLLRSNRLE